MKKTKEPKTMLGKAWYFLWESDSVWSWIADIVLSYVLIRFIVYPVLGMVLVTSHPIVAVVSGSMEHSYLGVGPNPCGQSNEGSVSFDQYWQECGGWYENAGIPKTEFYDYKFRNGFNKGDIMVLKGAEFREIGIGDTIVFRGSRSDPIIHRVVGIENKEGTYYFTTKGDHNGSNQGDDQNIKESKFIGRAVFRIPYLGYIKIWFVDILSFFGVVEGY